MLRTSSVFARILWFLGFIVVYSLSCFVDQSLSFPHIARPTERSSWRQFASVFTAARIRRSGTLPNVQRICDLPSWDPPSSLHSLSTHVRHPNANFMQPF